MFGYTPHLQCYSCSTITQSDTAENCWYTVTQQKIWKPTRFLLSINSCALLTLLWNTARLLFQWKIAVSALEQVSTYRVRTVYASQHYTTAAVLSCLLSSAFHSNLLSCASISISAIMPWSISEEWLCWRQKLIQQTVTSTCTGTLKWAGQKAEHLFSAAVTNCKALTQALEQNDKPLVQLMSQASYRPMHKTWNKHSLRAAFPY